MSTTLNTSRFNDDARFNTFVQSLDAMSSSKTPLYLNENGKVFRAVSAKEKHLSEEAVVNFANDLFEDLLKNKPQSLHGKEALEYLEKVETFKKCLTKYKALFSQRENYFSSLFGTSNKPLIDFIVSSCDEECKDLCSEFKALQSLAEPTQEELSGLALHEEILKEFINEKGKELESNPKDSEGLRAEVGKLKAELQNTVKKRELLEAESKKTHQYHTVMKLFYAKILDKVDFRLPSLEGLESLEAVNSLYSELTQFMEESSKENEEKLNGILEELKFAQEVVSSYSPLINSENSEEGLKRVAEKILRKISNLAAGQSCIFTGGYQGHAVLYEIKRELEGGFSFTIINTGEGSPGKGSRTQDVKYVNLASEELSLEFMVELLNYKVKKPSEHTPTMEEVLKNVDGHLFHTSLPNLAMGRSHGLQKKGTCSIRCLHSWLHGKMGRPLYSQFKVFQTEGMIKQMGQEEEKLRNESPQVAHKIKGSLFLTADPVKIRHLSDQLVTQGEKMRLKIQERARSSIKSHTVSSIIPA